MTEDVRLQIAALTLNEMMKSSFFSICAVTDAAKVLGCNPHLSEYYDQLRALHCVHWNRMPASVRRAIPDMIMQCLALPPEFVLATEKPAAQAFPMLVMANVEEAKLVPRKRSLVQRLFGSGKE
jgi:hypothetical protein